MNNLKTETEYILKTFPESRDSDKLLTVLVLTTFFQVDRIEDILKSDVPPLESITRTRRRFQEEGMYLSNKQVESAREGLEREYKHMYRNRWL